MLSSDYSIPVNHAPSQRFDANSMFQDQKLMGIVRQITNRRRVWWQRATTRDVAAMVLIADFISRGGATFLLETAQRHPKSFGRRVYSRLDNRARWLFQSEFGQPGHRKRTQDARPVMTTSFSETVDPRSLEDSPSTNAELHDTRAALRDAIAANLSDVEIEVIDQFFFREKSLESTAQALKLRKSTVRRIKNSAILKLRRVLNAGVNRPEHRVSASERILLNSSSRH